MTIHEPQSQVELEQRPVGRHARPLPVHELRAPAEGVSDGAEAEEMPAPAAAMLPADLLQPGEIIILLLKPSPWFILLGPLKTLIGLALATMGLAVLAFYVPPLGITQRESLLLGGAMMGLRLFWQFLEWLSRVYVLTDQRVIRVMGVMRISIFEAPLQQIQHTSLLFSVRERVLGLGTLAFATAGTGGYEAFWVMLDRPLEVHQKVVQTLRRYRR